MDIKFVCVIFSLIVCICSLIGLYFYITKKKKIKIQFISALGGFISCFAIKQVLYTLIARLLASVDSISSLANTNPYFSPFLSALINTFVIFVGFLIFIKIFFGDRFNNISAYSVAFGASIIDVLYNLVSPLTSYLYYYIYKINGGLTAKLLEVYDQVTVDSIISSYENTSINYYLYFSAVSILIIAMHVFTQAMLCDFVENKRLSTLITLLLSLLFYSLFYYFASPTIFVGVIPMSLLLAIGLIYFSSKILVAKH